MQSSTFCHPFGAIQPQQRYGCPTYWCEGSNDGLVESEMLGPDMCARVEEWGDSVALGVNRREIAALVAITLKTGKRQIVECRLPTMFDSNNVVNFVGVETDLRLVTIFALPTTLVNDCAAEISRDSRSH